MKLEYPSIMPFNEGKEIVVKSELSLTEKPFKVVKEGSVNACKEVLSILILLDNKAGSERVVTDAPPMDTLLAIVNAERFMDVKI